jgi:hypothetical protein
MAILRIKKWATYQHYKERNPPWIKLHRELLTSETWVSLSDASRVLAIALMLLAAGNDNQFEDSTQYKQYVKRVAYLDKLPDFEPLINCGFLEKVLANDSDCKRSSTNADPETETETEKSKALVVFSEPNGSSNTTCPQSSSEELQTGFSGNEFDLEETEASKPDNCPHQAIIDLYHKHLPAGTRVRPSCWSEASRKKLRRRWREAPERQNLEWWDKFFLNVSQLDFFMGRTEIDYQTNLDALISPKMFGRIISDHYYKIQQMKNKRNR